MTERVTIPCIDPARGEVFAHSPLTREADVASLIARSRKAQAEWAALPLRHRLAACRRLRDHLLQEADAIAAVISRDNGKTRVDAMSTEVFPALLALSYYMKKARTFLRTTVPSASATCLLVNKRSRLRPSPLRRDRRHLALELSLRHPFFRRGHGAFGRQWRHPEGRHPDPGGGPQIGIVLPGSRLA